MSGEMREPVCSDGPNPRVFPALKEGGVVAGFCGHDHTNDFCAAWEGVQLCYEGSPGFTAYGRCDDGGRSCYMRRARVTELQIDVGRRRLAAVRTWKRVDAGGSVAAAARLDDELLWTSANRSAGLVGAQRTVCASLDVGPRRDQPRRRAPPPHHWTLFD
mmetsp:Transcript_24184/g.71432  ORF Transcript_24184/g.71432 Transcript_24184/m.71432 type:complete len:160 (+) Transcript_24184:376-855(+)